MLRPQFIAACMPTLAKEPPDGPGWAHEVKFDGFRCQIHRAGENVTIYSRNGADFTKRYREIARDILKIPTKQFILDGELVGIDAAGLPAFSPLLKARLDSPVCVWVFDLLSYRGKDIRDRPYTGRRYRLDQLMGRSGSPIIRLSEFFLDPHTLLADCSKRGLEGIVSKRADRPYRSGRTKEWVKVKCAKWKEENAWRHEFFTR